MEKGGNYRYEENKGCKEKPRLFILRVMCNGQARDTQKDNKRTIYPFCSPYGKPKLAAIDLNSRTKKEFIGLDNRLVREQVIDYLFNNYEVTDQTLYWLQSDGGLDIHPMFSKIAKVLRIKRHEHFWDEYHVNKELKNYLKFYSEDLLEGTFRRLNNMISS